MPRPQKTVTWILPDETATKVEIMAEFEKKPVEEVANRLLRGGIAAETEYYKDRKYWQPKL